MFTLRKCTQDIEPQLWPEQDKRWSQFGGFANSLHTLNLQVQRDRRK
jgi:hypothetical protein